MMPDNKEIIKRRKQPSFSSKAKGIEPMSEETNGITPQAQPQTPAAPTFVPKKRFKRSAVPAAASAPPLVSSPTPPAPTPAPAVVGSGGDVVDPKEQFRQSLLSQARQAVIVDIRTAFWDDASNRSRSLRHSTMDGENEIIKTKIELARQGVSKFWSEYLAQFTEEDLPVPAVWLERKNETLKVGDRVSVSATQQSGGRMALGYKKESAAQ
jgi:hypothetical protein